MRGILLAASLALVAGPAFAQASSATTDLSKAPSGALAMETRHTEVLVSVLHVGPVQYYGRFDKIDGSLNFDPNAPEKSSVTVTIDTGSINFRQPDLIKEVTDKDAFDSADFPQATFKSTKITRSGPTTGTIIGDMTFRGVTKPVTLNVTYVGAMPNSIGFHATGTIKRSDFGMTGMRWNGFVSDDVSLVIDALFQKPRPAQ